MTAKTLSEGHSLETQSFLSEPVPESDDDITVVSSDTAREQMETLATLSLDRHGGFQELRGGSLGVRIAQTDAEREAAQALRYKVF